MNDLFNDRDNDSMLPYEHIRTNSTWNVYRSTGTETASYERVAVVCLPPRDTALPIKACQCVKVEVNMVQSGRRYLLLISICNFRLFLRFLVSRHFVAIRVNRIQCACFLKSPEQTTKNKGNNRPEWFCIYRSAEAVPITQRVIYGLRILRTGLV